MKLPGRRTTLLILVGLFVVVAAVAVGHPKARWRLQVISMKVRGELVDMSWGDVLAALSPDNPYDVGELLETGNPYRSLRNPYRDRTDEGLEILRARCAGCHGRDGRGATGPDLARPRTANNPLSLYNVIADGVSGTSMRGFGFSEDSIWKVVAYIQALRDSIEAEPGVVLPATNVSYDRILNAADEPGNWLTYSGSYDSHRHSSLDQISRGNASALRVRWMYQLPTIVDRVETTPLVVDGIMYLTEPPNDVLALDAASGQELWRYTRDLPEGIPLCCGQVNRGLAILDNRLYLGTLDARLVALDARTGEVIWEVTVAEYGDGYSMTGAPLALKDRVVVGVAGGEYGIRGFLDAYDAASGERVWRFYTVPGPGEAGHETWEGDSWRTGGAPTWITGSFDPELDLIYWGVGNPGPPWDGSEREGDNLYANCVVALDADSGELRWHFQFTPHDEHDWDATQIPVLVDAVYDGSMRKLMLFANRNAFYYVLDRETGEFLGARPYAKQTWAERIDSAGRPVRLPNSSPTRDGNVVFPSAEGATNWWSPSYSPLTRLFYVPTVTNSASVYFKEWGTRQEYEAGEPFLGSSFQPAADVIPESAILAMVPQTGEVAWEYGFPPRRGQGNYRGMGGVLSTAGGLVFAGDGDLFVALHSGTGAELWRFRTGGLIIAAPISYLADGRQHVALAAGRTIFAFGMR